MKDGAKNITVNKIKLLYRYLGVEMRPVIDADTHHTKSISKDAVMAFQTSPQKTAKLETYENDLSR